jgi:hypothetical protein
MAVVAVLVFFLVPLIPYRSQYYGVAGGTYNRWDSHVSVSYFLFGCGSLLDTNLTENIVGNGSWRFSQAMPALMLTCFYHPTQVIGHIP